MGVLADRSEHDDQPTVDGGEALPGRPQLQPPLAWTGTPDALSLSTPSQALTGSVTGSVAVLSTSKTTGEVCKRKLPDPQGVSWQWEHRTGFRDYKHDQNAKIEFAFQRGDAKVRLKTGKQGCTPMEIFFTDMIQLDTMTGNQRRVRRLGRESWLMRAKRFVKEFVRAWETGQPRRQTLAKYQSRQEELAGQAVTKDVTELYSTTSWCGRLVSGSMLFSSAVYTLVFANVVWIGVDVDWNPGTSAGDSPIGFQVVEYFFCAAFALELVIRFLAFRRKRDFILDGWFCFDAVLVLLMVFELLLLPMIGLMQSTTGIQGPFKNVSILRIARLLKLTRMTRLLRAVPELMTMLKGIVAALRSVIFTLLLQLLLLYIFGIVFCTWVQMQGYALLQGYFSTLSRSMYSLLVFGTLLDGPSVLFEDMISVETPVLIGLFFLFIILSSFTVLNMLVGLLIQVVADVHEAEKQKNEWNYLKYSLLDILDCYDRDGDQTLGKEEFKVLLKNPEVHDVLRKFGTDIEDMVTMADVIFDDATAVSRAGQLSFEELLQVINRLRGARSASVTDVVELRQYLRHCIDHSQANLRKGQCELLANMGTEPEGSTAVAAQPEPAATGSSTLVLRLDVDGQERSQLRRRTTAVRELLLEAEKAHGSLIAKDTAGLEVGAEVTLGELAGLGAGEVSLRLVAEGTT